MSQIATRIIIKLQNQYKSCPTNQEQKTAADNVGFYFCKDITLISLILLGSKLFLYLLITVGLKLKSVKTESMQVKHSRII